MICHKGFPVLYVSSNLAYFSKEPRSHPVANVRPPGGSELTSWYCRDSQTGTKALFSTQHVKEKPSRFCDQHKYFRTLLSWLTNLTLLAWIPNDPQLNARTISLFVENFPSNGSPARLPEFQTLSECYFRVCSTGVNEIFVGIRNPAYGLHVHLSELS